MIRSAARIVLGLFIVWQICFLIVSNVQPSADLPANWRALSVGYQQLTGQRQGGWAQFSPGITRTSAFVAVQCRWPDREDVMLLSEVEPRDPESYVQWPDTIRLANYESTLSYGMWRWTRAGIEADPALYRERLARHIHEHEPSMRAYMQWRFERWRQGDPGLEAPSEMILWARLYARPPPDRRPWKFDSPEEIPMARWRLDLQRPAGTLALEMYDAAAEPPDYTWLPEEP